MLVVSTRHAKARRVTGDERPQFVRPSANNARGMADTDPLLEPLAMHAKDEDGQATLELLEALLLECGSEGSDESVEDQAIEEFANEIDLSDVDDSEKKPATEEKQPGRQPARRRKRKCTYAARREEANQLRREAWSLHQQVKRLLEQKAKREHEQSALAEAQQANWELREQLARLEAEVAALLDVAQAVNAAV